MADLTRTLETSDACEAVGVAVRDNGQKLTRRRPGAIPITLFFAVAAGGVYAAYQRAGTTANADLIEFTPNLAGGFLAVGMSADQAGFVLLSALDQKNVKVRARQSTNRLAGTHTTLCVETPATRWNKRLRGPLVVLVQKDGGVASYPVDWPRDDFVALQQAADCSHVVPGRRHRCGVPFADLYETWSSWPEGRVPTPVRDFSARFVDHSVVAKSSFANRKP